MVTVGKGRSPEVPPLGCARSEGCSAQCLPCVLQSHFQDRQAGRQAGRPRGQGQAKAGRQARQAGRQARILPRLKIYYSKILFSPLTEAGTRARWHLADSRAVSRLPLGLSTRRGLPGTGLRGGVKVELGLRLVELGLELSQVRLTLCARAGPYIFRPCRGSSLSVCQRCQASAF